MAKLVPKIDTRTAQEIVEEVQELLQEYTGKTQDIQGTSAALVNIFARFAEIIIERLNQVPDKNFLAFLDLLGASRLPPQPARVPLTFSLAAGTKIDAVVPKGTQVAAPPAEGEKDPVIFETEQQLRLTAAKLDSIFVRDPEKDLYSNHSSILTQQTSEAINIFRGNQAIEHIFYIAHSKLFSFEKIENFKLQIFLSKALETSGKISWQIWQETESEGKWQTINPSNDSTQGLTQIGSGEIEFSNLTAVPLTAINLVTSRWLRCRLITPISPKHISQTGMVTADNLPEIEDIKLETTINSTEIFIETAFLNQIPVDLTKEFFPFGEKPKLGDTLYVASSKVFDQEHADITLRVNLVNPTNSSSVPNETEIRDELDDFPIPTRASSNLRLKWEFWNGKIWQELGTGVTSDNNNNNNEEDDFQDTTQAFTDNGQVEFNLFEKPALTTVNGVENFWIRVRIISGNYGKDARYERRINQTNQPTDPTVTEYQFIEATFAPPIIESILLSHRLTISDEEPEEVLTYNDFVYENNIIINTENNNQDSPKYLVPFKKTETNQKSLYLGFSLPSDRPGFTNRTISLFNQIAEVKYGQKLVPISPTRSSLFGQAGSRVIHKFCLTNLTSELSQFKLNVLGINWATEVQENLEIEANSEAEITISVEIPAESELADQDCGFLQVIQDNNYSIIHSATFQTIVGTQLPQKEQIQLDWQYWNGNNWTKLLVRDETKNFSSSGLIEFLPPADFAPKEDFNLPSRYWLRVQWLKGDYDIEPRLEKVLLNTTMVVQTVTIENEIVGSSDGSEKQKFQTTNQPILTGQKLEVRELEIPSALEKEKIISEEGANAITVTNNDTGRPQSIWVLWHQVPDFYQSEPRDRHYVLDNFTGKITFGDGRNGLIPPLGRGNIRMSRYQTGGGVRGNKPAGSIVQLKTTVPYVDKVINYQAAAGGAEAETLDSLVERAPKEIRHRQRAVTRRKYRVRVTRCSLWLKPLPYMTYTQLTLPLSHPQIST